AKFPARGLQFLPLFRRFRIVEIGENADGACAGNDLPRKLHLLGGQSSNVGSYSSYVAAWPRLACDQAEMNPVSKGCRYNRDRGAHFRGGDRGTAGRRQNDIGTRLNQFLGKCRESLNVTLGEPVHGVEVAPFFVATLAHTLQKGFDEHRGAGLSAE